jgi:hypothetical protein
MKALTGFIVSGRWQAVLVTTASGVLTFLLLPFSSMLNYLAAAAVALVTLHVGVLQGLQVMAVAAALTLVFYQLLGVQAVLVLISIVMLWLPCWLIGLVLRQTNDLGHALKAAVLFGICLLLIVYAWFGDPAQWWLERLLYLQAALEEKGFEMLRLSDERLLQEIAALMTGVVVASLVVGVVSSLLLARWWQSVLVHPGAFREEFCSLRLGYAAGLATLVVMLIAQFTSGAGSEFAAQLAMIMLVPYLLAGLAVMHSLVKQAGLASGWLVAVYVILAFVPQAMLLLAGGGLLDTWIDFRRRLARGGPDSQQ